eukprot:CAMPEP_0197642462 /NCGR_PEP_ID=MMETSP1338-20131121/16114_1 /TAXON_ID=43686 ORGANISM="Pelagodinium beii, Strain RCC1491" /NCGR_SAMPLE_ID=MMETSP1338 /ASSEMBLY_ACC=CAM_ASM_000754 /LENGTH=136 /DNA_ID=CAMNT_0043215583 /DNA_START=116 /DNA_END=523 /DNA_ORIENTATION=+
MAKSSAVGILGEAELSKEGTLSKSTKAGERDPEVTKAFKAMKAFTCAGVVEGSVERNSWDGGAMTCKCERGSRLAGGPKCQRGWFQSKRKFKREDFTQEDGCYCEKYYDDCDSLGMMSCLVKQATGECRWIPYSIW